MHTQNAYRAHIWVVTTAAARAFQQKKLEKNERLRFHKLKDSGIFNWSYNTIHNAHTNHKYSRITVVIYYILHMVPKKKHRRKHTHPIFAVGDAFGKRFYYVKHTHCIHIKFHFYISYRCNVIVYLIIWIHMYAGATVCRCIMPLYMRIETNFLIKHKRNCLPGKTSTMPMFSFFSFFLFISNCVCL